MRRPHHGGQNAREWRRRIAALARRNKESIATYKFRLEGETDNIDFHAAARAYDITEGIARGSLIGLVCAVHLSGFRLFSKPDETRQFRNRSHYPEKAFSGALQTHVGIENHSVSIQSLEIAFATRPRASGGVAPSWSADALARRLFQTWNGRSPKNDDQDQPMRTLANGIAAEVTSKFHDWRVLAENVGGALACADRYLASLGDSFPKLADLPPMADVQPKNCTFAYDAESPFVDMADNDEIWLHKVVATRAKQLRRDSPSLEISDSKFARQLRDATVGNPNNNGLSWLFGVGLRYLRDSDVGRIAQDLGVPEEERRRVEQLKRFADAIPPNPFFDTDGYAEFRGSVGGKIASWVSNYWKRICELTVLHSETPEIKIPPGLADDANAHLFSGQHTDAAGLQDLAKQIPTQIAEATATLSVLAGGGVPGSKDIETVERVASDVSEFIGQTGMFNNRIDQEIDHAEDAENEDRLKKLKIKLPEKFKEPPKLNRISGGTDDADGEIKNLESRLNAAIRKRREHFERLTKWVSDSDGVLDPWPAMIERERKALKDRGMNASLADEQALRRFMHRIVGMSRRLSPESAELVREKIAPLFKKKKEANRYFRNRRGAIYRHPRSTSRHQPYDVNVCDAREIDWGSWLEELVEKIRERAHRIGDKTSLRDVLSLEGFLFTERLQGLPDRVPGNLATPRNEDGILGVPPLLASQLDADEISRDVALRAFNLFNSTINGLSFRAFRESFIVRVKFLRLDHEELFYVPKKRAWRPPDKYSSAKTAISKGLALPAVTRDDDGAILPCETVEGLSKAKLPEPGSRALLRQAPHDWLVELDLRQGETPERAGLPVKKNVGTKPKGWRPLKRPAFRLVGPPSFKTCLDRTLTDITPGEEEIKLGDYTLILDRVFEQSLSWQDGKMRISAKPVRINAELAIPAVDKNPYPNAANEMLFDNIVAIDQGEKRIGFAVFSLVDFIERDVQEPVVGVDGKPAVGTVAVPAFRRLMAAVNRHRGSRQPNQKVGQTFSKALMRFRENVIGDVCNRIDTLCERHRAFPVLESSVGNFEAGGRQLKMIYGSVLHRYAYSSVEAHKTARGHYWSTADSWEHPYVHAYTWNEEKKNYSSRSKPLNLFPGVVVHPAGTSQTCHRCGRNAVTAMRNMPDKVEVEEGGRISLGDGDVIRLLERADHSESERKKFRRHKERPPLNKPVSRKLHKRDDLERILKRNLRQQPKSEMSPDTSQARFVCVYENCDFSGHADENAAINIGRRFLERIDLEASRKARG